MSVLGLLRSRPFGSSSALFLFACVTALAGCASATGVGDDESTSATDEELTSQSLGATLTSLGDSTPAIVSIAVRDLSTNVTATYKADRQLESASAAKLFWVAAAVRHSGTDRVRPFAHRVFTVSDNVAALDAILLAGGGNRVNDFYRFAGMHHSGFHHWAPGDGRSASANNASHSPGDFNYVTAHDALTFLTRLETHRILTGSKLRALHKWMKLSPNSGTGGWLGAELPSSVQATLEHKAGWTGETTNEIGIVRRPNGESYAVVILSRGSTEGTRTAFVSHASCVIYNKMAGASRHC